VLSAVEALAIHRNTDSAFRVIYHHPSIESRP
jgi:hypothetical protein